MIYYFVETGRTGLAPEDLPPLGIPHIVDPGDGVSSKQTQKGPGGKAGLFVCNKKLGDIDELDGVTWSEPLPGLPAVVRVGWKQKPTPEQLRRREQLPGYRQRDVDGREWLVPLVRRIDAAGTPLAATPCYLTFDAAGEMVPGEPLAKYRHLAEVCDLCWPRLDAFFRYDKTVAEMTENGEDTSELPPRPAIDTSELLDWLTPIIATNYYVGARELVLLGAWADIGAKPLTWLLIATSYGELLLREEWAEKKSPASDSSASAEKCSTTTPGGTAG